VWYWRVDAYLCAIYDKGLVMAHLGDGVYRVAWNKMSYGRMWYFACRITFDATKTIATIVFAATTTGASQIYVASNMPSNDPEYLSGIAHHDAVNDDFTPHTGPYELHISWGKHDNPY
jgi:hypothetical protein